MLLLVTVEGLSLLGVETVGIAFAATVVDTNLVASPVDDINEFDTSNAVVTLLSIVDGITSTAAETTTVSLFAEQFPSVVVPPGPPPLPPLLLLLTFKIKLLISCIMLCIAMLG